MIKDVKVVGRHLVVSNDDKAKMEGMCTTERRLYMQRLAREQGIHYMCGQ